MIDNNCYKCKYRGNVPGDTHSRCTHPEIRINGNYFDSIFEIITSGSPFKIPKGVKGDPHGIRQGWFYFPWNFDPIWLQQCDYFVSEKDIVNNEKNIDDVKKENENSDKKGE